MKQGQASQFSPTHIRYVIVGVATLMSIVLYLHRQSLSFLELSMRDDLGLTDDQVKWLLSAFAWSYALAQVPSGWVSDRFGVRHILALYIFVWSLFTGLLGAAMGFAMLVILRLGCGLAQAGAYPTSASLLSRWMPFSSRGFASGIVFIGGRLGGAAAPVLTAYLLSAFGSEVHGWRLVWWIYGAAGILVALIFWICFRDQPSRHPWCNADEVALIENDRPSSTARAARPTQGFPLRAALTSRSLWLLSLCMFATNWGWIFLVTWLPRYLKEVHQVPLVERGWMVGLPLLAAVAGGLLGGWVTDRLTRSLGLRRGRGLPLVLPRLVAGAAFVCCIVLPSPWVVTLALVVMSMANDLGMPPVWAYTQDVGGRYIGSLLGWNNMWGNFGAAISTVVAKSIFEYYGWNTLFLVYAGAYLLAGVLALGVDARIPIDRGHLSEARSVSDG